MSALQKECHSVAKFPKRSSSSLDFHWFVMNPKEDWYLSWYKCQSFLSFGDNWSSMESKEEFPIPKILSNPINMEEPLPGFQLIQWVMRGNDFNKIFQICEAHGWWGESVLSQVATE